MNCADVITLNLPHLNQINSELQHSFDLRSLILVFNRCRAVDITFSLSIYGISTSEVSVLVGAISRQKCACWQDSRSLSPQVSELINEHSAWFPLTVSTHLNIHSTPSLLFRQDIVLSRGLNMRSRDDCTMYTSLCFRGPLVRVFTGSGPVVVPCYLVVVC